MQTPPVTPVIFMSQTPPVTPVMFIAVGYLAFHQSGFVVCGFSVVIVSGLGYCMGNAIIVQARHQGAGVISAQPPVTPVFVFKFLWTQKRTIVRDVFFSVCSRQASPPVTPVFLLLICKSCLSFLCRHSQSRQLIS